MARLERVLRRAAGAPAAAVCDAVLAAVAAFQEGQPQNDDLTLVVARGDALSVRQRGTRVS